MLRPNVMYLNEERCSHCELCYLIAPVIRDDPQRIPVTSDTLMAMAGCPSGAIQWLEDKREGMCILDVRPLVPHEQYALILKTFDALEEGDVFELVNDYDPKPLYRQLQMQRLHQVSWNDLKTGPELWRVRISRL